MKQNVLTKRELSDINRQEKEETRQDASNDRLVMFRDRKGAIRYNNICSHCTRTCKQSFKAKVLECRPYEPYPRQTRHSQIAENER